MVLSADILSNVKSLAPVTSSVAFDAGRKLKPVTNILWASLTL